MVRVYFCNAPVLLALGTVVPTSWEALVMNIVANFVVVTTFDFRLISSLFI
jgi:hypothetical protein